MVQIEFRLYTRELRRGTSKTSVVSALVAVEMDRGMMLSVVCCGVLWPIHGGFLRTSERRPSHDRLLSFVFRGYSCSSMRAPSAGSAGAPARGRFAPIMR